VFDLEQAIDARRSIRMFLPDRPVPRELVDEALELAIRAPSNSNVQPWHLVLASGAARDRLVTESATAARLVRAPPQRARRPGVRIDGHHPG
jgi:nitroreductase